MKQPWRIWVNRAHGYTMNWSYNHNQMKQNNIVSQSYGTYCTLTHCGLVTPYGDRDLGQHWLRQWLVAWRHQAITWIKVDLSIVKSSGIHLMAISQEIPQPQITEIRVKITSLKFRSNLPGANELNRLAWTSHPPKCLSWQCDTAGIYSWHGRHL